MARMTAKSEALAYRIYIYANPIGWDCTPGEIAEALGVDPKRIGRVAHAKGWATRLRSASRADWGCGPARTVSIDTLDGGSYRGLLEQFLPAKQNEETA
jgi:hypothetical protein